MEPLAYKYRPKKLEDLIGQEQITNKDGFIYNMIKTNNPFSLIISGPPGVGKTSLAELLKSYFDLDSYYFNASNDNKSKLIEISNKIIFNTSIIVIIDEIHRLRKDTMDYLLDFLETGKIIIFGLTTENPYYSINPAIRSRCHIISLNPLKDEDIKKILQRILKDYPNNKLNDEILNYIVRISNNDARYAINVLELVLNFNKELSIKDLQRLLLKPNLPLDSDKDNYYNLLSALQKSIRGSDCNASLHYLARLIKLEDIDLIFRRLLVIAYEDIGLANPSMGQKVLACYEVCKIVGFPEARIPLSTIVIEMALAPKSNSSYLAIDEALKDIDNGIVGDIPKNILNNEIRFNNYKYLYPHDYKNGFVKQNYRISYLKNKEYYHPKDTSSYEKALKDRYELLEKYFKD